MDLYVLLGYTIFMNKEEIQVLADLSRLNLTDDEITSYQKDFEGILSYIDTLKEVKIDDTITQQRSANTNYLRNDDVSYVPGQFSEDLLTSAPEVEGEFIKVQKIL